MLCDFEINFDFVIFKKTAIHLFIESTEESMDSSAVPDVVKWLCFMDNDAARRTLVAVEKVLHDATFTNWHGERNKTILGLFSRTPRLYKR